MSKYYSCPFCPRGQFLLKFHYKTTDGKYLYSGKCDRCDVEFIGILFTEKLKED